MWYTWFNMNGGIYGFIFRHIMCPEVGLSFASDLDTAFGGGVAGEFELVVGYKVGSENGNSVSNDSKDEVYFNIGQIEGWGGGEVDSENDSSVDKYVKYEFKLKTDDSAN